jgi:hypothetical protein
MPFCYSLDSTTQVVMSTSSSAGTAIVEATYGPPTASPYPTGWIYQVRANGRGAGLTQLVGISMYWKYCTTASAHTNGTLTVPVAHDPSAPAAQSAAYLATAAGTGIAAGSGGAAIRAGFGFGGTGPGGWTANTPDAMLKYVYQTTAPDWELNAVSGVASMLHDFTVEHQE